MTTAIDDIAWANFAAGEIRDAYAALRLAAEKFSRTMREHGALSRNETIVSMNIMGEAYASLTERAQDVVTP